MEKWRTSKAQARTTADIQYVPLSLHVISKSDGTGGENVEGIARSIFALNAQFDSIGIRFYVCGEIENIASDNYYNYVDTLPETVIPVSYYDANKISILIPVSYKNCKIFIRMYKFIFMKGTT